MKYLVYNDKIFTEFEAWKDAELFMLDKPNAICKKITSKKAEEQFKKSCEDHEDYEQKFYIVIFGEEVKRFEKWKDAKEFINLHKGCKYRSFKMSEDAQEFINLNIHKLDSKKALKCKVLENGDVYLYKKGEISNKLATLENKNPIERELQGVLLAIKEAIKLNAEQIVVEYRQLGTEMWANGTWKANKPYSINYKNEIINLRRYINIDFKELK